MFFGLHARSIRFNNDNNVCIKKLVPRLFSLCLRWLNTVLRAVSGNSHEGACFKLDKQTWRRKKQWYTDDDFSKSTH